MAFDDALLYMLTNMSKSIDADWTFGVNHSTVFTVSLVSISVLAYLVALRAGILGSGVCGLCLSRKRGGSGKGIPEQERHCEEILRVHADSLCSLSADSEDKEQWEKRKDVEELGGERGAGKPSQDDNEEWERGEGRSRRRNHKVEDEIRKFVTGKSRGGVCTKAASRANPCKGGESRGFVTSPKSLISLMCAIHPIRGRRPVTVQNGCRRARHPQGSGRRTQRKWPTNLGGQEPASAAEARE